MPTHHRNGNIFINIFRQNSTQTRLLFSIVGSVLVFFFWQSIILYREWAIIDDQKELIDAESGLKRRRLDEITRRIWDRVRQLHRLEIRIKELESQVHDCLSITKNRPNLPTIFMVTPTTRRPAQKADLTRLSQTLQLVPNLFWLIVEDSSEKSALVRNILERSRLAHAHINVLTPPELKLKLSDKNWKRPRGVAQRNAALEWIRLNLASVPSGVVYFGDDDNTYDVRLFDEMRSVHTVGVWPVGLVGGLMVETPLVNSTGKVTGFNGVWKTNRPFPIDMAGFAINLSLILAKTDSYFTYSVPRGYQESHLLSSLGIRPLEVEPRANLCSKVLIWHTRTERSKMSKSDERRFLNGPLDLLEIDAVGDAN